MFERREHTERRFSSTRRGGSDRRRGSDARRASIEICHSVLRVAIVSRSRKDGPDTVVTRTIPWREKAESFHSETAIHELNTAFQAMVAKEKLTGGKLRISLSGELSVTRVVSGAADHVRRELAQLEERSQRYLALGAGKKALAGSVVQLDARHQHALLTIANQRTLDILVHVAEMASVQIESIEPSLVALSRVISRLENAEGVPYIVIHLDEEAIELGICHNGKLLLDYRPGGRSAAGGAAQIVQQHLPRLQRYCSRHYAFIGEPLKQVFISGDPSGVRDAVEAFAGFEEFEAQELVPSEITSDWEFVDRGIGSDLAATLGAALAWDESKVDDPGPNLIQHLIAQSRAPMRPILVRSLIPLAAVLAIAAFLLTVNFRQRAELASLRQRLNALAPVQVKTTELRLTGTTIKNRLHHLQALKSALRTPAWSDVIALIGQCMPNDVWLDRLTIRDSKDVVLAGASYADSGIYEFVRWLEKAPGLVDVALDGTRAGQTANGPSTNFDIDLALANLDDYDEYNKQSD